MQHRIQWVDVAKALGIIAVVIGHASAQHGTSYQVLYWWHMPLFFMIGGFFIRPQAGWQAYCHFIWHRLVPLYVQYLAVGALITLIDFSLQPDSWTVLWHSFMKLLYGGTLLNGSLSVFWYMTVYLLAVAIAVALISFVKWCWLRWGIVLGLFVLGLTYDNAKSLFGFTLPWDADVALVAICYVYVGYQLFGWVKRHLNCWWLIGLIFSQAIFFIWAQAQNKMHFVLYMKSHQIAGPTFLSSTELALLLPVIFSIGVFVIAHWVAATPLLPLFRFIGQHTLVVMYWHKLIFTVLKQFSWDSPVLLISCGLLIPLLLAWCQQAIQHLWQRDAWLWRPFRQHRYGKVGVMKSVH